MDRIDRRSAAFVVLAALFGLLVVNLAGRNWVAAAVLAVIVLTGAVAVRRMRRPG